MKGFRPLGSRLVVARLPSTHPQLLLPPATDLPSFTPRSTNPPPPPHPLPLRRPRQIPRTHQSLRLRRVHQLAPRNARTRSRSGRDPRPAKRDEVARSGAFWGTLPIGELALTGGFPRAQTGANGKPTGLFKSRGCTLEAIVGAVYLKHVRQILCSFSGSPQPLLPCEFPCGVATVG